MVDPGGIVVNPCVGMGVELDQRHGAELLGIGAQDRQGHEMIAPQRDGAGTGVDDAADMRGHAVGEGGRMRVVEGHVARVHDAQFRQRIVAPAIGRIEGLQRGRLADGTGSEAGAGAVRHALIEGDACDGEVRAGHVLGIAPSQERGRTGEGVLERQPAQFGAGEGLIDLGLCVFESHGVPPLGRLHSATRGRPVQPRSGRVRASWPRPQ